nr:subunit VI of cytochrome b6/f complex [Phyllosiphon coccidium]WDY12741.1 subunit VI of cytochrome b6/f complex [Phyllosiphon coccidium]
MVTIISYIAFLIAFIIATLSLYISLLKIKLI